MNITSKNYQIQLHLEQDIDTFDILENLFLQLRNTNFFHFKKVISSLFSNRIRPKLVQI